MTKSSSNLTWSYRNADNAQRDVSFPFTDLRGLLKKQIFHFGHIYVRHSRQEVGGVQIEMLPLEC